MKKTDMRNNPVPTEMLEHIARQPTGGSGNGEYIRGRIQSMARELLQYRGTVRESIAILLDPEAGEVDRRLAVKDLRDIIK